MWVSPQAGKPCKAIIDVYLYTDRPTPPCKTNLSTVLYVNMQYSLLSKRFSHGQICNNKRNIILPSSQDWGGGTLMRHYISILPIQKVQTGAKWEQEELFSSAFIFLMNLSLWCGHSYCWDRPESCADQLESGTWPAGRSPNTDFKP